MSTVRLPSGFRSRRVYAVALLLSVGAVWLYAHEGHAPISTKGVMVDPESGVVGLGREAQAALGIETAPVTENPVPESVLGYVTLETPWPRRAFASARLPGRVVAVHARPAQSVESGQVLVEIASPQLESLRLDLLTAKTELELAEQTLKGLEGAGGAIPQQTLLDARMKVRQQQNSLAVGRARWAALGLPAAELDPLLTESTRSPGPLPVRSPIRGTVVGAAPAVGTMVEANQQLGEVADTSRVWARVGVLEKDLGRVAVGQSVEVRLTAHPGEVFRGAVQTIGTALDPVTHLTSAWAEFENPPGHEPKLLPGMTGQARIVLPHPGKTLTVPAASVVYDGLDRYVLVEDANTDKAAEFRKVSVQILRRSPDTAEVRSGGLLKDDQVLVRGANVLGGLFVPEVLRLSPEAVRQIGVFVAPAGRHSLEVVAEAEGLTDLTPEAKAGASAPLAGTIQRIATDRGRPVRRGEVLAEVYSPELHALQLDLLREHLTAELLTEEYRLLQEAGPGVPRRRLMEADAARTTATNRRDNFRRQLELTGLTATQIDQLLASRELTGAVPVRSPVDGVVAGLDVVVGQSVRADQPLVTVQNLSRPLVRAFVPQGDAARVRVGQPARVRLVSSPGTLLTGRVTRSNQVFSAADQAVTVWVELDAPPDRRVLPNQTARVTLVSAAGPPMPAVPHGAVARDGTRAYVFVRKPDGAFDRRAVELGRSDDRFVEVLSGLTEGEPVAVSGATGLQTAFGVIR
ncbi:MAG TPA: efflux RND transporter periplasmic adaptor subunit [Fimbriiglobus sp.]|nr:efflux RND transporter periplasmic adaptor subunit [Fimbriiglobus sp.]